MPFTLLGAVVMGLAAAGMVMLTFRLFGRAAPRWLLPAAAGGVVLVYIVWSDYTWFARTAAALPPQIEVAATFGSSSAIRPWTLIREPIERFIAVDRGSARTNPEAPGYVMANVYLLARYLPTGESVQLYDCERPRRADLGESTTFEADGLPPADAWVPIPDDHGVRRLLCRDQAA